MSAWKNRITALLALAASIGVAMACVTSPTVAQARSAQPKASIGSRAVGARATARSSKASEGPVASVAGAPISMRAYKHWMYVAAKATSAQASPTAVIVATDPPRFTGCIAKVRRFVHKLAKAPAKKIRADCKLLFTELNNEVLTYLIQGYSYQADASALGIKFTHAQLLKQFSKEIKAAFPTSVDFKHYLQRSGQTKQDLLFQVRVDGIYAKLSKRFSAAKLEKYTKREWGAQTLCVTKYLVSACDAHGAAKLAAPYSLTPGITLAPSGGRS